MSRKKILKNIKKDKDINVQSQERDGYFSFVTTLAVLLIVFVVSYLLIGFFYTKELSLNKNEDSEEEVNVDNSTIMIGQLFEQKEDTYYVIIYDVNDKKSSIPSWLSVYILSDSSLAVYTVDSSKKFNSSYLVTESSNKQASSLDDLRVISPTLIKISNKTISEYTEGEEDIINILRNK